MALNDSVFSGKLLQLYTQMGSEPMSAKDFADKMAQILDEQTKTAEVPAGIPVATTGSSSAQSGNTTGPGQVT